MENAGLSSTIKCVCGRILCVVQCAPEGMVDVGLCGESLSQFCTGEEDVCVEQQRRMAPAPLVSFASVVDVAGWVM